MREKMILLPVFFLILTFVNGNHDGSDDPLDWLRESVPGEPGVDYPVFAEVEETGFDCSGRIHGGNFIIPVHFLGFLFAVILVPKYFCC